MASLLTSWGVDIWLGDCGRIIDHAVGIAVMLTMPDLLGVTDRAVGIGSQWRQDVH